MVESSVPALFAAQVQRAPGAMAVSFDGRSMTYRELDEASNRLAALAGGAAARGPGECVALAAGARSARLIVAILAVLKSGAAYPADRPGSTPTGAYRVHGG